jgi:uncharacterized membrane protein YjfL (UPF0719 family)
MPTFFIITYIVYITIFVIIFYFIYTWVTHFLRIKQEQNTILRELVKKLELRDSTGS